MITPSQLAIITAPSLPPDDDSLPADLHGGAAMGAGVVAV
jgi:hypothetical protein